MKKKGKDDWFSHPKKKKKGPCNAYIICNLMLPNMNLTGILIPFQMELFLTFINKRKPNNLEYNHIRHPQEL